MRTHAEITNIIARQLINKKEKLIIDAITKHLGYLPDKELLIANLRKVINTDKTEDIVYDGVKLIKFTPKTKTIVQQEKHHTNVSLMMNYQLYE